MASFNVQAPPPESTLSRRQDQRIKQANDREPTVQNGAPADHLPGAPPFAVFERWEGSNFGEQISAPLQRPAECTASAPNSALSYLGRSQADRLLAARVNKAPR